MTARRVVASVITLLISVGVMVIGPGVASAAGPTFERITIEDEFVDEELSEACGVTAMVSLQGEITLRTFADKSLVELRTVNLAATITTEDGGTFRLRDVGSDITRVRPDGTVLLMITGQVPFFFAGALVIDVETGEAILEPRDRTEWQTERACRALTGG